MSDSCQKPILFLYEILIKLVKLITYFKLFFLNESDIMKILFLVIEILVSLTLLL